MKFMEMLRRLAERIGLIKQEYPAIDEKSSKIGDDLDEAVTEEPKQKKPDFVEHVDTTPVEPKFTYSTEGIEVIDLGNKTLDQYAEGNPGLYESINIIREVFPDTLKKGQTILMGNVIMHGPNSYLKIYDRNTFIMIPGDEGNER